VLDEPTTGLHFEDIRKLLGVLESLVDKGNTVIVIEHNLDVIKTADWLIDMGPEGGHRGGTVLAAGTPEEVADVAESHTGQHLRHVLGLDGEAKGAAAATSRAAKANGSATKANGGGASVNGGAAKSRSTRRTPAKSR
jgi:excinuclease ABC subunit A